MHPEGHTLIECTATRGGYLASWVHLSRARRLFLALQGSPSMVSTSLFTGEYSVCSLFPAGFCLYGLALFAIGLSPACSLATTLDLTIHCNTAIRPESVRCALLTCGLISICQLVTTLDVVVRCNIAIKPESIRCIIVVFRQMFSADQQQPSTQPSSWSLSTACWQFSDFYQSTVPSSGLRVGTTGLSPQTEVHPLSAYSH